MNTLDQALDALLPLMASNPTRPEARDLLRAGRGAARHPRSLATVASLVTATAAQAIQERFHHPLVQTSMAQIANYGSPITGEGTGANLMLMAVIARTGMGRPIGGWAPCRRRSSAASWRAAAASGPERASTRRSCRAAGRPG